jgi:hypothetical protein
MPAFFRIFTKNQIKSIFKLSKEYKLTDEEFIKRGKFVITTMGWCNYETKCFLKDFVPFHNHYNPNWIELYEIHIKNELEIKKTNPLLPRLQDENDRDYYKRMDAFLL